MKTFSWTAGVALLAILALQGCSTNPKATGGASIQDFARNLNGKVYLLEQEGRVWVPSTSGELVTDQRIPKGLFLALTPAQEHCTAAGGQARFTELQAAAYQAQLPRRLVCSQQGTTLWVLDVSYGDVRLVTGEGAGARPLTYLRLQTNTQLLSADQFAARLREEEAQAQERDKAAAAQRERQAVLERDRQQRIKDQEVEARRVAAQWPARVAAFQANLKVGDRFKWASPPRTVWSGPFVGMVVRVEGALAFVQFDNLTMGGQQTRYLPKVELEPFDGPTPNFRGTVD